jgi:membrane protease subunit HflK
VLKAGQERERAKNEAQAYANDVVPRAGGTASRLKEEAEAYKARVWPRRRVMRSASARCWPSTRRRRRSRVTASTSSHAAGLQQRDQGLVESRQGSNLLYLPLDKIMQSVSQQANARPAPKLLPAPRAAAPAAARPVPIPSIPVPAMPIARASEIPAKRRI